MRTENLRQSPVRADVRADPVRKGLRPARLGVELAGCAHDIVALPALSAAPISAPSGPDVPALRS
jgi:hypothetical protein